MNSFHKDPLRRIEAKSKKNQVGRANAVKYKPVTVQIVVFSFSVNIVKLQIGKYWLGI